MQLNFNATTVAPSQAFENLAPGWYTAKVVESEMKPSARTAGANYLELTLEVIAPASAAGRKLWDRLNLVHPNQVAVDIAYETLSAICHATQVMQVQDSQQLHGIPLDVKVGMSKTTEEYPEPRNEIKGYRAVQGGGGAANPAAGGVANPAMQQAPQQMAQQAAPVQQAPAQQQWQAPAQQQQAPVQQAPVQQAPVEQAPVQQQAAPVQQVAPQQAVQQAAQPEWANTAPQQQAPQQAAQQAPAADPNAPQHIETANQPATDANAQAAAATNQPPWMQNQ